MFLKLVVIKSINVKTGITIFQFQSRVQIPSVRLNWFSSCRVICALIVNTSDPTHICIVLTVMSHQYRCKAHLLFYNNKATFLLQPYFFSFFISSLCRLVVAAPNFSAVESSPICPLLSPALAFFCYFSLLLIWEADGWVIMRANGLSERLSVYGNTQICMPRCVTFS